MRIWSILKGLVRILYIFYTCLCLFRISPEGVDIVLDCLCGEECNKGYALLKPMGKYILYGSSNVVTGETKSFFSAARSVRNLVFRLIQFLIRIDQTKAFCIIMYKVSFNALV